jgi:transposase-like protein
MGHLWDIVEAHHDRYGPSVSEIARRMDVGSQTLFNWRDRPMRELPRKRLLEALAEVTGRSYDEVLRAALLDIGYVEPPTDTPQTRSG